MNFSKEYIELCKNKKIQELRPKLQKGDWVIWNNDVKEITVVCELFLPKPEDLKLYIWLPTTEQLDEEIIKICKENNYCYYFHFIAYAPLDSVYKASILQIENLEMRDSNPLICKIKLLIKLLEEDK